MLKLNDFINATKNIEEQCLLQIRGGAKEKTEGGSFVVTDPNGYTSTSCCDENTHTSPQGSTVNYSADTKENGRVTEYKWCPEPCHC